ncbi:hypothetical protein D3C80_825770 [compost metagenome]
MTVAGAAAGATVCASGPGEVGVSTIGVVVAGRAAAGSTLAGAIAGAGAVSGDDVTSAGAAAAGAASVAVDCEAALVWAFGSAARATTGAASLGMTRVIGAWGTTGMGEAAAFEAEFVVVASVFAVSTGSASALGAAGGATGSGDAAIRATGGQAGTASGAASSEAVSAATSGRVTSSAPASLFSAFDDGAAAATRPANRLSSAPVSTDAAVVPAEVVGTSMDMTLSADMSGERAFAGWAAPTALGIFESRCARSGPSCWVRLNC